jgi:hypothetical protein
VDGHVVETVNKSNTRILPDLLVGSVDGAKVAGCLCCGNDRLEQPLLLGSQAQSPTCISLSLSRVLFDRLLPKSCMKQSGNTTYHLFPRMFNNQHGYLRSSFRCAAAPFRRRKAFQDLQMVTGNSCLEHLNPCFILYIYRWYDNRCFIRFFIPIGISIFSLHSLLL